MSIDSTSDFLKKQYPHQHAAAIGCIKGITEQRATSPFAKMRLIKEVLSALDTVLAENNR